MKKLLLLIAIFPVSFLYAQIPNSGFEIWDSVTTYNIANWQTLGTAASTTDAKSGNLAIAVYNKKDNSSFGVFANAPIQEGLNGGEPYNERPVTFSCYAKYDIDSADRGSITAIFKSLGNVVGIAEIVFRGTSNDQYVLKSIPIQWYSFDQPDTVYIIGASIDLDKGFVEEDGFMYIDSIHFKTVVTLNKLPQNASFENQIKQVHYQPKGWVTVDKILEEEFGQSLPITLVNRTSDAYQGMNAIVLENKSFGDDTLPGIMFVGTSFDNLIGPTFSVIQKSTYLNGYYKYIPENGDKSNIQLVMYKNGAEVGKILIDDLLPTTSWKPFSKAIGYFNSTIPDSASLLISASDFDNPKGVNSKLWIDALALSNEFLSVESAFENNTFIYPNPAENQFYIPAILDSRIENITIKNLQGQQCLFITDFTNSTVDISSLSSGLYWVEIKTNRNSITSKLIKK